MVSIFVKRMSFIGSKERLIVLKKKKKGLLPGYCNMFLFMLRGQSILGKIAYASKRVFSEGLVDFVLGIQSGRLAVSQVASVS